MLYIEPLETSEDHFKDPKRHLENHQLYSPLNKCSTHHCFFINHFLNHCPYKFSIKIPQNKKLFFFKFRLLSKMGVPKFYRYMSERYPCLSQVRFSH